MKAATAIVAALTIALGACDVTTGNASSTTSTTIAAVVGEIATTVTPSETPPAADTPPLFVAGCSSFDGAELGSLTRMDVSLELIAEDSSSSQLFCSFVGVSAGRDASATILVAPLSGRPEGYYRTAGEFETELLVAGLSGVGTGRGSLRAQLTEELGLTFTVDLRSLSSDVVPYTDREHLEVRDALAAYVVGQLVP